MGRPPLSRKLEGFGTTIFAEMSALAAATGAVNLGQGFPDTDGPREVLDAAVAAMRSGQNQYPPGPGIADLRHAIADHQRRFYGLEVDPDSEVFVTTGATEAIAASLLGLLDPGDEVVAFEPYYDSYAACIAMAGAVRRPVTLRAPDFVLDHDELRRAVTPRTRLHPPQHAAQPDRQGVLARGPRRHRRRRHRARPARDRRRGLRAPRLRRRATCPSRRCPGMAERTVTISSAGKTFSFTGWKVGWVCAPPELVAAVRTAKQFLTYVSGAPFQPAVAVGLRLPDSYFEEFTNDLRTKRDRMCAGLEEAGFRVYRPAGTYFITTDIRPFGETRRPRLLPLAARAVRRRGRAQRRVLRRQGGGRRRSCASPSASATRSSTRPSPG